MKRSTFLSFITVLIAFGIYFRAIDPLLASNRWLAFAIFAFIWLLLRLFNKAVEGRFAFLDKRIEPQTSVWLVAGCLILLPWLIFSLG